MIEIMTNFKGTLSEWHKKIDELIQEYDADSLLYAEAKNKDIIYVIAMKGK